MVTLGNIGLSHQEGPLDSVSAPWPSLFVPSPFPHLSPHCLSRTEQRVDVLDLPVRELRDMRKAGGATPCQVNKHPKALHPSDPPADQLSQGQVRQLHGRCGFGLVGVDGPKEASSDRAVRRESPLLDGGKREPGSSRACA